MGKENYRELSSFLDARERWMWSDKALASSEQQEEKDKPEPRCYRPGKSCDLCEDYYTCLVLKK